jgi:hypothetical protein
VNGGGISLTKRGRSVIGEKTGVKFVNLVRKEFGKRMRQRAKRIIRR